MRPEIHAKRASRSFFAVDFDMTAVLVDDLRYNRQAESYAVGARREERVEDAL
jgi:hypothetical protein